MLSMWIFLRSLAARAMSEHFMGYTPMVPQRVFFSVTLNSLNRGAGHLAHERDIVIV